MKSSFTTSSVFLIAFLFITSIFPSVSVSFHEEGGAIRSPSSGNSLTPWFDTDWDYRKNQTIFGSTEQSVTNYSVKVVVHRGSGTDDGEHFYCEGECEPTFGDIRFTSSDGVTLLSCWLEDTHTSPDSHAIFWVSIPYIPLFPGNTTIWMYYGCLAASTTSDIDATFDAACDMEEGDLSDWDTHTGPGTQSVSTSYPHTGSYCLEIIAGTTQDVGTRSIRDISAFAGDHAYGVWVYDTLSNAQDYSAHLVLGSEAVGGNRLTVGLNGGWDYYRYFDEISWVNTDIPRTLGWHHFEYRCDESTSLIHIYVDGVLVHESDRLLMSAIDILYTNVYRGYPSPGYFDDIIVRNWVYPEPYFQTMATQNSTPPPIFLIISVVVVFIIVVAVVVLYRRRGKMEAPPDSQEAESLASEPSGEEALAPSQFNCAECGTIVPAGQTTCSRCGAERTLCMVCSQPIGLGDDISKCPYCGQLAHRVHLLEWLKTKGVCPRCKKKLREVEVL